MNQVKPEDPGYPAVLPEAYVYMPTGSTLVSNPMDLKSATRCRVYVQMVSPGSIRFAVQGAPNENGIYMEELDPAASERTADTSVSFILSDVSRFLRITCRTVSGRWMVWVVPVQGREG